MKSFFSIGLFLLVIFSTAAQSFKHDKGYVNQKSFYEVVPFEVVHEKMVIPVEINGKTYRFLVDTGAPNVISKEVYEEIKPQLLQSIEVGDINNKSAMLDLVVLDKIKLGELVFSSTVALVKDLKNAPVFHCFGVDGLVGSNLFKNAVVHFDWKNKKITLTDKAEKLELNTKPQKLKLIGAQKAPYVEVSIIREGYKKGSEVLLVDTGADGFYDISKRAYDIFKNHEGIFEIKDVASGSNSMGIFGSGDKNIQMRVQMKGIKIAGSTFENVLTDTTESENSRLGLDILKFGNLTLDFKSKKWYYEGIDNVDLTEKGSKVDLTFIDNKLVVGLVWDESLKNSIAFGDEIIKLDETDITVLNPCELLILRDEFKPKYIVVKTKDGTLEQIETIAEELIKPE